MPGFMSRNTNSDYYNDVAKNVAGLIWEPADWAIAASDGIQWYDGLGMLPLIPASWGDNIGRFVAKHGDRILDTVTLIDNPTFRIFTPGNFRTNLSRLTGFMPTGEFQAHHILPQKFRNLFEQAGFVGENSIDNPLFGSWVKKNEHLGWTRAYQQQWEEFFLENIDPTMEQILDYAKLLAEEYDFDTYLP